MLRYILNKPKPVKEVEEEPAAAAVDETTEKAGDEAPVTEEVSEESK